MDAPVYGPNTRPVRRFLQRFAALDARAWDETAAAFAAVEATRQFAIADGALAKSIEGLDRTAARDAVLGPIAQLTRTGDGDALHPVAAAALGAALALMMRDVLDDRHFDLLYSAFAARVPVAEL